MPKKSEARLSDDAARTAIREDLGTTILVEAAAGTGKTTSLVDRMVALIATGRATTDRLSAVTFTIKAAAQLGQKFQGALEQALRDELDPTRRERLAAALASLDSCFLGTIHAFGARLLRERPVEAGVEPGFVEMDEPEDGVARAAAWERFTAQLYLANDPRLAKLLALGIRLSDLESAFETVCENSDLTIAAGTGIPEPDFSRTRSEVEDFLARWAATFPAQAPEGGWTEFQESVRSACRLRQLFDPSRAPEFVRVLRVLRRGNFVKRAPAEARRLREETVKPALERWAEYVHPLVVDLLADAREKYREWRRREGKLNFQDLLLYARDLLRDHPEVRRALFERFTPILVDEFQDTDPIQAEILFLLTGKESDERDWRKLTPVPGALFVVGDPKQSIYRFRRADIETYEAVRRRIARSGRLLELSTNFRSTADVCDWVNGAFGRLLKESSPEQAAYVALSPYHSARTEAPAVFRLSVPSKGSRSAPVVDWDSRRIAETIASETRRGRRSPGDFLILFRQRRYMAEYARALEGHGVPCEIAGGGAFGDSEELDSLLTLLGAVADPDDPVLLLAALRGPLFGVDDEALYRFARSGGRFHYRTEPPTQADPRIRRAFEKLREGEDLARSLPPGAAISRFSGSLGWTALAAAEELGSSRAGNLLKAFAAARKLSGEGRSFAEVVEELRRMRQETLIEQMSVEPGRGDVVRLMTVHGAKGLEAKVVFLAEPATEFKGGRDHAIDRSVEPGAGHFRIVRRSDRPGDFADEEIARPLEWKEKETAETRFEEAEKIRMLYVAATRAREMLVVSVKKPGNGKPGGAWAPLDTFLRADLPERTGAAPSVSASLEDPAAARTRFSERAAARRAKSAAPSYATAAVTFLAHSQAGPAPARQDTGRGMEWGRIIHRLLEEAMRDPEVDVRAYARNLLAEAERPASELEDAVRLIEGARGSGLWERAVRARRRLVEVPFALPVSSAELSANTGPPETVLSGAIDLAFEEDDSWILVDYKSDHVAGNFRELADWYSPQIRHYRRYWEKLTGKPTRAGLFFVETGQEFWLADGEMPAY
jgi:ATP-dependent helicase/nuclease subunit A